MSDHLIAPHGGALVDLLVSPARAAELREASRDWFSWDLTSRQLCDLELLLNAGFSPLTGFMTRKDYDTVCADMRLANGAVWPIPITLDITEATAEKLAPGASLALRDAEATRQEPASRPVGSTPARRICSSRPIRSTSGVASRGYSCPFISTSGRCGTPPRDRKSVV